MRDLLHTLTCRILTRWRFWRHHQPLWWQDKTARMLGISCYGCWRCGRGAIAERDRASSVGTKDGASDA